MKIAIINPPSPFLTDQRVFYNRGLLSVATNLEAEGHNIKYFDFAGKDLEVGEFDAYLFSSTTPQFPYTYKLFKKLKKLYPNSQFIIGGAHASALSSLRNKGIEDQNIETLNEFDTVFEGDGEDTEHLFEKGWVKGRLIKDLDETLIPNTELIDIKSYKYKMFGKLTTNILTQRGCPYRCTFCCGRDIEMYNRVRSYSPERVLKEMDELHDKYGYSSFMFYDDEINLNISRLEKLCKALSERPYQHRGFVRSDMIVKHPESVQWMKEAGFVKLCAGVESGSNRMLKMIDKKITAEEHLEARRIIKEAGIHYEAFMLLGHPGETIEDVEDTFIWLKEAKPDDFDINLVTPYPGSIMYDEAVPANFKGYKWQYKGLYFNKPDYSKEESYYKGLDRQSKSNIRTKEISNETYIKLRDEIDKEIRCHQEHT